MTQADNSASAALSAQAGGSPPPLTSAEQREQAVRCSCHGSDDLCPCQNRPDQQTKARRAALSAQAGAPAGVGDLRSGQQGGAVPAGDLALLRECEPFIHFNAGVAATTTKSLQERIRARLAEQPAPAGTGYADRVEGVRPGLEKALEIVKAEMETVSSYSGSYQRLRSVKSSLRAALDGASGQDPTP